MQTCDLATLPDFYKCAQYTVTIALSVTRELPLLSHLLLGVTGLPGVLYIAGSLEGAPMARILWQSISHQLLFQKANRQQPPYRNEHSFLNRQGPGTGMDEVLCQENKYHLGREKLTRKIC